MGDWYSRPVLRVADIDAAAAFYVGKLGFQESWRHVDGDALLVAQVAREGCELILWRAAQPPPGPAMIFISLKPASFAALKLRLAEQGVAARDGWWGYRSIMVDDPDGNQLTFPDPDDPGDAAGDS